MKIAVLAVAASLALLAAGQAVANITYVASRAVGDGSVDLSFTTDGTLGELSTGNILDWTVKMTDGSVKIALQGPGGLNNSAAIVFGHALSATASDLIFDYDVPPSFFANLFAITTAGPDPKPLWCVSNTGCFATNSEVISVDGLTFLTSAHSERFVVASVASSSAAPEPAAWALTIAGFGLAGSRLRRRSGRVAA